MKFGELVTNVALILVVVMVGCCCFLNVTVSTLSSSDVYYSGNTLRPCVSFAINVYWGNEYLNGILEVLDRYDVITTFFVGGCWVAKYPDELKNIVAYGHEIGNHGYYHKDHDKLTLEQNTQEITACHKVVNELTAIDMTLFAPPSGYYSQKTVQSAKMLGYKVILWTKDTIDWRDKDAKAVYNRATSCGNGAIILMHPTEHTLEALPKIIEYYIVNGFKIVPVSENINGE